MDVVEESEMRFEQGASAAAMSKHSNHLVLAWNTECSEVNLEVVESLAEVGDSSRCLENPPNPKFEPGSGHIDNCQVGRRRAMVCIHHTRDCHTSCALQVHWWWPHIWCKVKLTEKNPDTFSAANGR